MNEQTQIPRRRKGQGSISRKPNGSYVGRISVYGYDPYSCTGKTQKEVVKKLQEFKIRTLKQEVMPQKIFVNKYIESWLENVKKPSLKPASYDRLERTYQTQIKGSQVGRCQLGNITSMDIQRLINEKSDVLSYSSLKKIYELLNSCFNYAVISRQMNFNPVDAVKMPKRENMKKQTKAIQIFTKEELDRIEAVSDIKYKTGEARYRHAQFFMLLANTGMRAGEAIALTWKNVDFDKRIIYIRQNASCIKNRDDSADGKYKVIITSVKTKSGNREIPLNDKALAALHWLKKYQEEHHIVSDYVDCNCSGEILRQQTLPKILCKILLAADVPYKNVHSFRHTFATNLIKAGVDVKIVSQLLGHHSVKITYDTYVHTGLDQAVDAVMRLNSHA